MQTNKGDVITGWRAKHYDHGNTLFFVPLINKGHIKQVGKLKTKQKVLDIGCGTGAILQTLAKKHPQSQYYGIEPSEDLVKICKERFEGKKNVTIKKAYGQDTPWNANTFDAIISCLTLHHVNAKQKKEILRESHRILKKDGKIIITDFGKPQGWFSLIIARYTWGKHSYSGKHTQDELIQIIEDSGFTITKIQRQLWTIGHIEAVKE